MKVLITGITGFVGSHLSEYLLNKKDVEIYGIIRWRSDIKNISHIKEKIKLYEADIRDFVSVKGMIAKIKPDKIFHLAAQSFVGASFGAPQETLTTNIVGELNIFEAVRSLRINPFILIAGSSEEYGLVHKNELPIKETNPLRPLSPYAVSKVTQDILGYQYFKSYGLNIIVTRAFNHTGPRRGEPFVSSNFAKQIAMIEKGKQEPVINVGNLETVRDFSDVRDVVRAYWLSLDKCKPGEVYNICSGKGYKIKEILNILLSLTKERVKIKEDPERLRPSDVPVLIGDCAKFRKATGWKPEIPFEKTLEDLLNYWRENI
ncbi:MAG: GDP-mannose 4,6-dehydratase [Candidatus Omnitrophota bacterium]|nr:GDP-mannose 4,6-dehydratase [Candidatus Omnitrophota bacterium]